MRCSRTVLLVVATAGCTSNTAGPNTTAATIANSTSGADSSTSSSTIGTTFDMASGSPSSTAGTSMGSTGQGEPVDLSQGSWEFENISDTPAMSIHARRATLMDGREFVGWAETNLGQLSVLNVFSAVGPGWNNDALTAFDDVQNTLPSMWGDNFATIAWVGRQDTDDDNDVYFAVSQGDGWGEVRNLSDGFEDAGDPASDTRPVLWQRPDGVVVVAWLSSIPNDIMPPPPDVLVTEFMVDNNPSATTAVVNPNIENCTELTGAVAPASGVGHLVIRCAVDGSVRLLHGTDRSGEWDSDELAGLTSGILSPNAVRGNEGVHAVWIQDVDCGGDDCGEVFHARTDGDDVFTTPVAVTDSANLEERLPTVGVDPWGRVLVFSQARVDGNPAIYLAISEDGGDTFGPSERISPDSPDGYQAPRDVGFDANGSPSFVLEVVFDDSDPLNIDIYRAQFVPE